MATSYKLGNILTLDSRKGKIVNVYKPIGTYPMFTVHFYDDGSFKNFAAHELAKAGSSPDVTSHIEQADEMSDFSDMFDNWDYTEDEQTVPGPNQSIMSGNVHPEVPGQSKKVDNSRFQQTDDIDVQNFVLQHENVNTKRKTESHIKLLHDYLQSCGEVRECHEIPPSELDKYLSRFLLSVRQRDGKDYEPTTLRGIVYFIILYHYNKNRILHFSWLGPELLVCCLAHRGPTGVFLLLRS